MIPCPLCYSVFSDKNGIFSWRDNQENVLETTLCQLYCSLFKVCFGHILFDTSSCHVLSLTEENIDHMENLSKDINFFYCHQMKVKWNWFIFYYDRFIVDSSRVNAFGKATTAQLNNTLHRIWQKGSTFQLGPPSKNSSIF